jgi:hypothetical protein
MSHANPIKRRNKVVPVLGAAGLSLSLAGGASAATGGLTARALMPNTGACHEITLSEEEVFDVSLATFYVANKENAEFQPGGRLAMGGGGGCGCGCGCGCGAAAAAAGNYAPESETYPLHRSIKPTHPPKRTHVPRNP